MKNSECSISEPSLPGGIHLRDELNEKYGNLDADTRVTAEATTPITEYVAEEYDEEMAGHFLCNVIDRSNHILNMTYQT